MRNIRHSDTYIRITYTYIYICQCVCVCVCVRVHNAALISSIVCKENGTVEEKEKKIVNVDGASLDHISSSWNDKEINF